MLKAGRAKVFRRYPFTIILQDLEVENCVTHNHQLKIDPGSKTTGLAILQDNRKPPIISPTLSTLNTSKPTITDTISLYTVR
jgi:hypothetical protein